MESMIMESPDNISSLDLKLLNSCALAGANRKIMNNMGGRRFNGNKKGLSEIYELIMNEKIALGKPGVNLSPIILT
jgi:hypothetical protein